LSDQDSEDLDGTTHGHLDVDGLNVMPSLLEEGSKEVCGHDDVLSELLISHLFVSDSDVQVGNFLELPLNGGSDIIDLL